MMNPKLVNLVPQSKKYIFLTVLSQWISLLFQIVAVFAMAYFLESLYLGILTSRQMLWTGAALLAAIVVRYVAIQKSTAYSHEASCQAKTTLRNLIYNQLMSFGLSYSEKVSTAQMVQLAGEGVEQIEVYFSRYLPQFFYSMLAPVTLFLVLSRVHFQVALILLACVPLIPLSIVAVNKISKRLFHHYWGVYTSLGDQFIDNLGGLVTLKIYQSDGQRHEKMNENAEQFRKITMQVLRMQLNSVTVMDLIAYGGAAVGILFALKAFGNGSLSLAHTVAFILLASEFFLPLRLLGSFFHIAMNGMAAAEKTFQLLALEAGENPGSREEFQNGPLRIKGLNFGYRPDQPVLQNIDLEIPPRSLVSVVGASGSGKSTLAALLMGFHRVKEGELEIGDVPLSDFAGKARMKHFCLIKHENYLFAGTVRENLLAANPEASEGELYTVLRQVALDEFVLSRGGLDMVLYENAGNLSGGQAQRLALARALLQKAQVYLFDEATSNIDMESETAIQRVMQELAKEKTVIQITHRLANVVDSDEIIVLEKGKLVQQGTHSTLVDQEGVYRTLFRQQRELEAIYEGGKANG